MIVDARDIREILAGPTRRAGSAALSGLARPRGIVPTTILGIALLVSSALGWGVPLTLGLGIAALVGPWTGLFLLALPKAVRTWKADALERDEIRHGR
jgi:hypothetical protein